MSGVRAALRMATLGDGVRAKTTLFLVSLLGEWRCPRDRPLQLRLRAFDRSFTCLIDDHTQLLAFKDVFLDEDYRVGRDIAPRVIVDLGSNVGASLIYFRLCYPYARLIGVEADPVTFKRLQRNVAQFHGIEVVNAAVARESGMMPFLRYSGSSWANSLIPLWERTGQGHIAGRPLRRYGLMSVDLLKMDIEGAEWQVLPNFRQLDKVRTIIGEIHRIDQEAPRGLLECLSDFRVAVVAEAHHVAHFVATRD
ncbi:MAG: FkbM family methyltransferase [Solirubrobacterales bacterium]|nr:FkbM family methyltransferase [Solirubrobacterales bacterium]